MPKTLSVNSPALGHQRVVWIDAAKGVSILLVVIYHANIIAISHEITYPLYNYASAVLKPVRMPLFFAISGFLAASTMQRSWHTVLNNKFFLYLYLFGLWSMVHIAFFKYITPHPSANFSRTFAESILSGFVRPQTGIWFIWALSFYFLFARALVRIPVCAVLLSLMTSIIAFSPLIDPLGLNFAQESALKYITFFVIPAMYGMAALERVSRNIPLVCMIIAAVIAIFLISRNLASTLVLAAGLSAVALNICGMIGGVIMAVMISKISLTKKLFGYLGKNTLPIYLIHLMIIALVAPVLGRLLPSPLDHYVAVPLLTVTAIAGSLFMAWCLKQAGAYWFFALPRRPAHLSPAERPNLRY